MGGYIAFDLDALNAAPHAARASGICEDTAIAGLARMWAWCWREETDQVTPLAVKGFFGADVSESLVTFGFLDARDNGFRVCGADRYLRVSQARKTGGKKASGNLVPGAFHRKRQHNESIGLPSAAAEGQPNKPIGLPWALTANSEQRTYIEKKGGEENTNVCSAVPLAPPPVDSQSATSRVAAAAAAPLPVDSPIATPRMAPVAPQGVDVWAPAVMGVYAFYRETFGRRHPEPSAIERDAIMARLREGFAPEELCKAVQGLANSEWHRLKGFTALTYALGGRDAVERCIQWAQMPPDEEKAASAPRYDPNQGMLRQPRGFDAYAEDDPP